MATRKELTVDDSPDDGDDGAPQPEPMPDKSKRLRKGWKDPTDPIARGKFKTPKGNIREDF